MSRANDGVYNRFNIYDKNHIDRINLSNINPNKDIGYLEERGMNSNFLKSPKSNYHYYNKEMFNENTHNMNEYYDSNFSNLPDMKEKYYYMEDNTGQPFDVRNLDNYNYVNDTKQYDNHNYHQNNEIRNFDKKDNFTNKKDDLNSYKYNQNDNNYEKELKRKQQQIYRQELEKQIREQTERKNRERIESRGLDPHDYTNNKRIQSGINNKYIHLSPINKQEFNMNFQNHINPEINSAHGINDMSTDYKMYKEKFIQDDFRRNENKLINDIRPDAVNYYDKYNLPVDNHEKSQDHRVKDYNNPNEKLIERQKKLDYQNFLKNQIEEKKKRLIDEKKKRLNDDIKHGDKPNKKEEIIKDNRIPDNYKRESDINNPNTNLKNENIKNFHFEQQRFENVPIRNDFQNHIQRNDMTSEVMQHNDNFHKNYMSNTILRNDTHIVRNDQQIVRNEPHTLRNESNNIYYQQVPEKITDNNLIPNHQYPYMVPPIFEEMLRQFFHEQVKLINTYKQTIDKMNDERDKAVFENIATREKLIAMNQLKTEQEKIKNNIGFYPFDNQYNKKIENMFNDIIEDNINGIRDYEEDNEFSPFEPDDQYKMTNLDYKSKYEDMTQSIISDNEMKNTLAGFSKFVKIDADEDKLIETWRGDDFDNNNNITQTYIDNNSQFRNLDEPEPHRISYTESMSNDRKYLKAKSANNPPFEFFRSQKEISIAEKDKSLFMEETQNLDVLNENYEMNDIKEEINYEEEDFCNPDYEEKEYSQTFHNDNEIEDTNNDNDINFEEFKEIHEVQKLQTKANFFENSDDNHYVPDSKHIVNTYKIDPKDRLPREISSNNINKLNNLYEKYNMMKYNKDDINVMSNKFDKTDQLDTEKSHKKYNPINEVDNEDSLINDLTKIRKIALNEINQSELSVVKSKINKYNKSSYQSDRYMK